MSIESTTRRWTHSFARRARTRMAAAARSMKRSEDLYELLSGADDANAEPARSRSSDLESKERLRRPGPSTSRDDDRSGHVIVACDMKVLRAVAGLFPQNPGMAKLFERARDGGETAKRNSSCRAPT